MTLEGCVVRISDLIAYIGRDIEDAFRIGILKYSDIPKEITSVLGKNNSEIINTIINDIIVNSFDKPYIKLSEKVFKAIEDLKAFNYKNIYFKANSTDDINRYDLMFRSLFNKYMSDLKSDNRESTIFKAYLNYKNDDYKKNTNARIVIDYIAGMTDDYFIKEYDKTKTRTM